MFLVECWYLSNSKMLVNTDSIEGCLAVVKKYFTERGWKVENLSASFEIDTENEKEQLRYHVSLTVRDLDKDTGEEKNQWVSINVELATKHSSSSTLYIIEPLKSYSEVRALELQQKKDREAKEALENAS